MTCDFRVVVPARFGSTRLPGKPLREICGRPMIWHVWQRALESGCGEALVATDDMRIMEAVAAFGGRALMTSTEHASGTDRLAEVARAEGWARDDIVVNLQGDEPYMPGALVRQVASALATRRDAGMATLATPIVDVRDVFDPNVVKTVLDASGLALYFSRAPIPWHRESFPRPTAPLTDEVPFLRHLGLYAYRVRTLEALASAPPSALERAESLEQLRALGLGIRIQVTITTDHVGHGVDTEADLEKLNQNGYADSNPETSFPALTTPLGSSSPPANPGPLEGTALESRNALK